MVSGRKWHVLQILNKNNPDMNRLHFEAHTFHPTIVQKSANKPEGQVFIKKLLGVI